MEKVDLEMSQLKKVCEAVIEATSDNNHEKRDELSCEHGSKMAQALLILVEALEKYKNITCRETTAGGDWAAKEALAKANAIFEEKTT